MSKKNKSKSFFNDSETDDDAKEVNIPTVESDSEDEEEDAASNDADHGQTFDIPTKLALVNCLKDINKRKTITYKQAIKTIDWTKVDITGHSQEELKECLNEILTSVCSIRTLDEMLDDYIENYRRYELKKNPNAPKIPTNPCMQYITEHRAELQKKLKKKYPGESITLGMVSKYGSERFNSLPQEEIDRYKKRYKEALAAFHKDKAELIRNNPELKAVRKPVKAKPRVKKVKEGKEVEETIVTPFKLFYEEMKEKDMRYQEAQAMYKNLGDVEKLKYINKVIALDTTLGKHFTVDEKKIMKHSNGMPIKPLSAYNHYVRAMRNTQSFSIKAISEMWNSLSDEEKKSYFDKNKEETEQWHQDMLVWVKTLPPEQQAEQIAQHKLFKVDTRKRKLDNTVKDEKKDKSVIVEKPAASSSPKKKKKNEDIQISDVVSLSNSPKKEKGDKKVVNEVSWDSVFRSKSASPKKENNIEKTLASFGTYPSLTTAHYFMVNNCVGKSAKKVAKAYKELSPADKKRLFQKMNAIKSAYLAKMKTYAEKITEQKHRQKILDYHQTNKAEQESNLGWHKSTGTDNDNSSSEEDDDDSDDS